jgi:aconitate hydratase
MLGGKKEGGYTKLPHSDEVVTIFDAASQYKEANTPLVVFAGKEYGTGSSRDWAAKGTLLLGVKAVIAESFERIHRSNLIGMGVMPLCFKEGDNITKLAISGNEKVDILGIDSNIKPRQELKLVLTSPDGSKREANLICRLDTSNEVNYYKSGGILQYVLENN